MLNAAACSFAASHQKGSVSGHTSSTSRRCVGAWYEMRNALHWYYLSQLWALGVTVQQWVHDLYDAERTTILCDEPGGGRDCPLCRQPIERTMRIHDC